jgi:hypothetical protein
MTAESKGRNHSSGRGSFGAAIAIAIVVAAGPCAPFRALAQDCPGDCSGDLIVSVDEVVSCIGRALGADSVGCAACDADEDGQVAIDELVEIVGVTLLPLVITAEGVCMSPGPEGLVSCPSGTEVSLSRCADRSNCLDDPDSLTPLDTVTTDADGNFILMTCRGAASPLLFEAAVEADPSSHYHTMDFGPLSGGSGFSAGAGRGAGRVLLGDLEISPRSEAAIRLLSQNGLENFTDEGVIEIIETVARATADTNFAGLDAAAAADLAESDAQQDRVVQATIDENRLQDVVITQEGTVQASSVFGGNQFPATLAIDENRETSWFSDGEAGGEIETFQWMARQDNLIGSVTFQSNREHPQFPGFGFGSLRIDILDVQGASIFTSSLPLPGATDPDITVFPNVIGRSVLLTFTGHDDPSCGGFSELIVVARR